jgi:hypothetical protein
MSITPQPPQPPAAPAPPAPPKSSSHVVAIVLLSLAVIVLACVMAVWIGLRFLSRGVQVHVEDQSGKQVSIKTPFGGIEVNKHVAVTEADLGLPIYPGATAIKDDGSANVDVHLGDAASVHVSAGKFETPDSLDKVTAYYREHLRSDLGDFTFSQEYKDGKTVFELKHNDERRVVALKQDGGHVRIELVKVSGNSGNEPN